MWFNVSKIRKPEEITIPDAVRIASQNGQLTIFVGNGLSRIYGLPSWDKMADLMLKQLAEKQEISYSQYEQLIHQNRKTKISIADYYFKNKEKKAKLDLSYRPMLSPIKNESGLNLYKLLASFGARFLTTNYDTLLDHALQVSSTDTRPTEEISDMSALKQDDSVYIPGKETNKNFRLIPNLRDFSPQDLLQNNVILHLHGSVEDEENMIVSTKDYLSFYGNPGTEKKLQEFLDKQTIVFFGYGLDELEILESIFRGFSEEREQDKYFLLLPLLSYQEQILEQLELYWKNQLDINLIPYNIDKSGYKSINKIIENWSSELSKIARDPYGRTPLHLTIIWDRSKAARTLIKEGVNLLSARDNFGYTPIGLANSIISLKDHLRWRAILSLKLRWCF